MITEGNEARRLRHLKYPVVEAVRALYKLAPKQTLQSERQKIHGIADRLYDAFNDPGVVSPVEAERFQSLVGCNAPDPKVILPRMTKIMVGVNQQEAIRGGFNADSSVALWLQVSELHQSVRDFIADRFIHGHMKARPVTPGDKSAQSSPDFIINRPDEEGLRLAIESAMVEAGTWVRWEQEV
jgi:hypothetical protein